MPIGLVFEYGEAMPWFGEVGGATQIKSSSGLHELIANSSVKIKEKWQLVDGEWVNILYNSLDNSAEALKARQLINSLKQIEEKVTQDLSSLANKYGGNMEGLDFRLKSEESLIRKLQSEGIKTPMNDVLRYTTTLEDADFTSGIQNIIRDLEKQGYEIVKIKNTFVDGVVYKGINTNVKSPDGQLFELQYHTPSSFNTKQNINHTLYEEYRLLDPISSRAITLEQQMINNSRLIVNPPNVQLIK